MDSAVKTTIICIVLLLPLTLRASQPAFTSQQQEQSLILGVLPFTSPVALLKRFAPLRDYLQEKLARPVIIETASNFNEFVTRTQSGRYDFVLTAPHFTLLALDSGQYELKATYLKPLTAAISVRRDSTIRRLEQLSGKSISTPPDVAIITMAGKAHIKKQHLQKAPGYISYKSHNASINAVMVGDTDAAIASINPTRQFIKNGGALRIISATPPLPGMGLLVAKKLPSSLKQQYQDALVTMHKNKEGQQALKKMGYPGYRRTKIKEFESTRAFLEK